MTRLNSEEIAYASGYCEHLLNQMKTQRGKSSSFNQDDVYDAASNDDTFGQALHRTDHHLTDILLSRLNPLTILSKDRLLDELYDDEGLQRCSQQMAEVVRLLVIQNTSLIILRLAPGRQAPPSRFLRLSHL